MSIAQSSIPVSLDDQQHIVLEGMSWDFYEQLLKDIGDGHTRVTYDNGLVEIMSPLPKHDGYGFWIASLLVLVGMHREITVRGFGSTTFRSERKKKGLEPDQCFYIQNAQAAAQMWDQFDPAIHAAPDLAVEIDITRRSVPRQPIYAALGVPELWRFDGSKLEVLHLSSKGNYEKKPRSLAFPFLPMPDFAKFIPRVREPNQYAVLAEFRDWLAKLPK
jgi:Uma2 family endonuclease